MSKEISNYTGAAQAASPLFTTATPDMAKMIARPMDRDVRFTYGVAAARLPDGSWNIATRAAAQGNRPRDIVRLRLDVATDKGFGQIILSQPVTSLKANAYMVRLNVRPKVPNNLLYFRFVVLDVAPVTEAAITQASFSTTALSMRRSPIGELNPWTK